MNAVIYFLHVVVTLAVPCLLGWVVLRRVVRECDWLVLVPGSLVVGVIALMALMNELRFVFGMERSAWFAYKLLLLLALVVMLATRRAPGPPVLPRAARAWGKVMLVAVGAALAGTFFGIPATRGILNDAWWFHYPVATQIQTVALFPLTAPFAPDDPLYYHIGPDILAATWAQLFDRSIPFGFACNVLLLAPATFGLAFALVLRMSRSYLAALAAAGLILVGGNLRFLGLFAADFTQSASLLSVFNSQTVEGLLELMVTPSHAVGVPALLAGLVLFRHLALRGGWGLAAVFGLWMGALTLIAEWYFIPLFGAAGCWAALRLWRRRGAGRPWQRPALVYLFAFAIAPSWALFNNTYAAGIFNHFWWRPASYTAISQSRQVQARIAQPPPRASAVAGTVPGTTPASGAAGDPAAGDFVAVETSVRVPKWSPPDLLPLRLNTEHFGRVPSWEGAASAGETFIPLLGWRFLSEFFPVIGLGLPFLAWLALRRMEPGTFVIALMALGSLVPPVFLDWGYRSSDFLRFLTGCYVLSALGFGWLLAWLWESRQPLRRAVAVALAGAAFANAVGLAVVGLRPETLRVVQTVGQSASSLSDQVDRVPAGGEAAAATGDREAAFAALAAKLDHFLTPITRGRDRAVVIVPPDQVPPTTAFPDWLKLATTSRLLLPIGWHWNDSLYAAYYREAVTSLEAEAITGMQARWVIVSNLFQPAAPDAVQRALRNRERFSPAAAFRHGGYYLHVYQVRP